MTKAPWAILLCKFAGGDAEPYPVGFFERLFGPAGRGAFGMVDYVSEMSHGRVDVSGSRVFGWLRLDKARSDYVGSGANPEGRRALVDWARAAAAAAGHDLSPFFNVVVVTNEPTDLFGGPAGVVTGDGRLPNGMSALSPSVIGHEMLHAFGAAHSRREGFDDYSDRWDVMSVASAEMAPHPVFADRDGRGRPVFRMGPGLGAAGMDHLGWLDPARVWRAPDGRVDATVRLRPLHRRDLPGFLAARFGELLVEFRTPERWDAAYPRAGVFVRRLVGARSELLAAADGGFDLQAGASHGDEDDSGSIFSRFTSMTRIEVVSVNAAERWADVRLRRRPARMDAVGAGPSAVFGGVRQGGGGFVITGSGGVKVVPPRSPLAILREAGAVLEAAASLSSPRLQEAVTRAAMREVGRLALPFMEAQAFHEPAPAEPSEEPSQEPSEEPSREPAPERRPRAAE